MKWYILKYVLDGRKYSCRIRAYSFDKAVECAKAYAGSSNIISITQCSAENAVKA